MGMMANGTNGLHRGQHKRKHSEIDRSDGFGLEAVDLAPNSRTSSSHSSLYRAHWKELSSLVSTLVGNPVVLQATSLSIAQIVAASRYNVPTQIGNGAYRALEASRAALNTRLADGEVIYGVNTGFGGTADVRTKQTQALQQVLIRELHYGILGPDVHPQKRRKQAEEVVSQQSYKFDLDAEDSIDSHNLPSTWARAAILIRINSLVKGASGVRPVVVERMRDLLEKSVIPMIPLRGSISACGDLSPLSYIGGAIQGKPTIKIISKEPGLSADRAFADAGLEPVVLQAKEGLAIVNGTAISSAVGALALHDAHGLAVLAQILTAMSVEALTGTTESFHPFFSEARPHPGQIESARNILSFLDGSKLVKHNDGAGSTLRQDRYSIRTAPQWIGPILEDFVLAHQQMLIECNSATDNPLVTPDGEVIHGGNFQAKAVTSAMEKVRQGLQGIGRMLFTQCVEMINPSTSRGLPPNLVAEDPSASYIFKGTDMNVAALQSELGFLSAPVNHVQTAEMGNQSLNSLALISARYTCTAVEVLSQMIAAHLVAVCQAFDLRAMQLGFLSSYEAEFHTVVAQILTTNSIPEGDLIQRLWDRLPSLFEQTVSMDVNDRFSSIAKSLRLDCLDDPALQASQEMGRIINDVSDNLAESMQDSWVTYRDAYLDHGDASAYLGKAARMIYSFVRRDLAVPLLHTARLRTPVSGEDLETAEGDRPLAPTVGHYTSVVYRAVRDGSLASLAMELLPAV